MNIIIFSLHAQLSVLYSQKKMYGSAKWQQTALKCYSILNNQAIKEQKVQITEID